MEAAPPDPFQRYVKELVEVEKDWLPASGKGDADIEAHRQRLAGELFEGAAVIDLVGHSTPKSCCLKLGDWVLDPAAAARLASYLPKSVKTVRLIGCNTARTEQGRAAAAAFTQRGLKAYGTLNKVYASHFDPQGVKRGAGAPPLQGFYPEKREGGLVPMPDRAPARGPLAWIGRGALWVIAVLYGLLLRLLPARAVPRTRISALLRPEGVVMPGLLTDPLLTFEVASGSETRTLEILFDFEHARFYSSTASAAERDLVYEIRGAGWVAKTPLEAYLERAPHGVSVIRRHEEAGDRCGRVPDRAHRDQGGAVERGMAVPRSGAKLRSRRAVVVAGTLVVLAAITAGIWWFAGRAPAVAPGELRLTTGRAPAASPAAPSLPDVPPAAAPAEPSLPDVPPAAAGGAPSLTDRAPAAAGTAAGGESRPTTARPPAVSRSELRLTTVQRGPLAREVHGQGTLVHTDFRWVSAPSAARVERVLVRPGAQVEAATVLIELSSPAASRAARAADDGVAQAAAKLAQLSAEGTRLAHEAVVRDPDAPNDLKALQRDNAAQLVAQRAQVERLRERAGLLHAKLDALRVRAGQRGIVQEVAVKAGQSVAVGEPLAQVVVSERLQARLRISEASAGDVAIGLAAAIDTRAGIVAGKVVRIEAAAGDASVTVVVTLTGALPAAARAGHDVAGTITLARTGDVLYMARPANAGAPTTASLFVVRGGEARRVSVQLGRAGARGMIEIVSGLSAGDRVVLSDMSKWDGVDRLRVE